MYFYSVCTSRSLCERQKSEVSRNDCRVSLFICCRPPVGLSDHDHRLTDAMYLNLFLTYFFFRVHVSVVVSFLFCFRSSCHLVVLLSLPLTLQNATNERIVPLIPFEVSCSNSHSSDSNTHEQKHSFS